MENGRVVYDIDNDTWFEVAPDTFVIARSWAAARDMSKHLPDGGRSLSDVASIYGPMTAERKSDDA